MVKGALSLAFTLVSPPPCLSPTHASLQHPVGLLQDRQPGPLPLPFLRQETEHSAEPRNGSTQDKGQSPMSQDLKEEPLALPEASQQPQLLDSSCPVWSRPASLGFSLRAESFESHPLHGVVLKYFSPTSKENGVLYMSNTESSVYNNQLTKLIFGSIFSSFFWLFCF